MAMDASRFDRLTRSVAAPASRRSALAALGAAIAAVPSAVGAKKRRRRKVKRNAFGCVDVGGFCTNAGQCCSGICRGKKGKKKCRAHDSGVGCQAGVQEAFCGGATADTECTTATGIDGVCDTTTGNAGYCLHGFSCFACARDAECQEACGLASAVCVRCAGCPDGTACGNPTGVGCPAP